ncbi:hypothetical protein [Candidatus Reidiella endopervernicosa]|uniref:Uncharacterized protein n=1 Tax=Candidatus Reidiella endopervernicosa TaxID=2738883 RepID=A0A6N0HUD4_9GAMM|nr:hypothetical protein [Candidatus Reidiella endopervernicosa]QKQ25791.1 hypothetical protein HUE57_05480 [Candidatus Reidiella endopervernicosa]
MLIEKHPKGICFAARSVHAVRENFPGVAIFAKVCFGHPSPSKQQNLTRPFMPTAPRRPAYVA